MSSSIRSIYLSLVVFLLIVFMVGVSGCDQTENSPKAFTPAPTEAMATSSPITVTPSAVPSALPSATNTPTLIPSLTPEWVWNEPGEAAVPILLYHHIRDDNAPTRYAVSTQNFERQMNALKEWGYTTISMELLLDALEQGASLPPRPIVITFDDGHSSVYDNAYPIMQSLGFTGTLYIVANRVNGAIGFMPSGQLIELVDEGWEIGSHGMTHTDLTQSHDRVREELLSSRLELEETLDIPVTTFAYPFGLFDTYVGTKVGDYGYRAAVGLGKLWTHNWITRFYLSRIEIHGTHDITAFGSMLPWNSPPGK